MSKVLMIAALTAGVLTAAPAFAQEADAVKKCAACHTFDKGGAKKIGPNLFGVYGRAASVAELAGKNVVWDDAALDVYLTNPSAFLAAQTGGAAKSKMPLLVKDPAERQAVIGYLKTLK
jgi:cytochrome c